MIANQTKGEMVGYNFIRLAIIQNHEKIMVYEYDLCELWISYQTYIVHMLLVGPFPQKKA